MCPQKCTKKKELINWTRATSAANWQSTFPDYVHFGFTVISLQEKALFLPDDAFTL
jgi:hypothetical protein